ncbi:unnamed protein product [Thlaspi arvense]|uniref:Senescence-associated carboxylesterase 101 n=1 Tax=Thlaspi arvense TaxID=13288 RepID=A0AAU9SVA7_THLAR|nr:unnamed protein product [Thlaspi arvense]
MDSYSLKGIELGKLVLSSGLLDSSWSKISEIHKSNYPNKDSALGIKIYREAKFTFVVFAAPPLRRDGSLNPTSTLLSRSENQNPFQFLCSDKISSFSLHKPAYELFSSAYKALSPLKSELLESNKPVIITGAALAGSVASLFTLWLLETIDPKFSEKKKETIDPKRPRPRPRPLCITFGSPLIGDASLQRILENSLRNSCFLHVADAAQTLIAAGFEPFGSFLICFDSECNWIEDPEAVKELLKGDNTDLVDYGKILHRLKQSVFSTADSAGLITNDVIKGMKKRLKKKKQRFDQVKKLNDMKIAMAYMERYKKKSKEKNIGYYDDFKTQLVFLYEGLRKQLNDYWVSVVEEAEKKPQSDVSILRKRFLLAGNNYRRLMEPFDIAEYYRNGGKDYRNSDRGRSSHYVTLEKWFGDASIEKTRGEKSDLSHLLTFDSCFWAEVEEAMIVIKSLETHEGMRDEASMARLVKFEEYVWGLIGKREVSPEIFLEKSSFMKWWKEYKEIKGFNSDFTEFMNTGKYKSYGKLSCRLILLTCRLLYVKLSVDIADLSVVLLYAS